MCNCANAYEGVNPHMMPVSDVFRDSVVLFAKDGNYLLLYSIPQLVNVHYAKRVHKLGTVTAELEKYL